MYDWKTKRRTPYTERGVRRLPCARCGSPAAFQWQVCADGGLYRPICRDCDVKLNAMVLLWMNHPQAVGLLRDYAADKGLSQDDLMVMT